MYDSTSNSMWRRFGGEIVTLLLLVPLAIVLATVLQRHGTPASLPLASPSVAATSSPLTATPTFSPAPTASTTATTRHVTLTVVTSPQDLVYTVPVGEGATTVEQVLTNTQAQGLHVKTKDYGGSLGVFVEELNHQANDPGQQLYWHLYINGSLSPLGASSAQVKAGDTIRWILEKAHNE